MKIEKLKPGMRVFDVGRQKMGNTTMSSVAVWDVNIVSIDPEKRTVTASWNGNRELEYYERTWSKWRDKEPMLVKSGWGYRLATRAEIAAAKVSKASPTDA